MIIVVLNILIITFYILGIIVCALGMKTKNILYKGGFYFFVLLLIENMYSLFVPYYIQKRIDQGVDNPGLLVRNSSIPPLIIIALAQIILITFLIKGLNKNSNS